MILFLKSLGCYSVFLGHAWGSRKTWGEKEWETSGPIPLQLSSLYIGDTFLDPQWMAKSVDRTESNTYTRFIPVHAFLWWGYTYKLGKVRDNNTTNKIEQL
jgi:hypothetical protein